MIEHVSETKGHLFRVSEFRAIHWKPVSAYDAGLFLASSTELREDRGEFDLYFRQQNDSLDDDGILPDGREVGAFS